MRIGLYRGSLHPAHDWNRHDNLLALKRLRHYPVWRIVTPGNPLKDRSGLPQACQRAEAARGMARHPRIDITCFEEAIGARFTVETLTYLTARCPTVRFVWIMGADSLASFHRWRGWQAIASLMPVAVIDRPGWTLRSAASKAATALGAFRVDESDAALLADLRPPAWAFLHGPRSTLSSSELRKRGATSAALAR
jgi:nicotinate-nucleotide adenylyltransferase